MNTLNNKREIIPSWMKSAILLLAVSGIAAVAFVGVVLAFVITAWLGQPVPILGFEQSPEQPISFPHTIHASTDLVVDSKGNIIQGIGVDCTYCHRTVVTQSHANVPAVELCAFCHRVAGDAESVPLEQVRRHAGITGEDPLPIDWRRVHRLPDHVRFVHSAHIEYLTNNPSAIRNPLDSSINSLETAKPSQVCSTCHGDVARMEQVEQVEPLKMGQCVNCHRDNGAPADCSVCHH